MAELEDIRNGSMVTGILPGETVQVVSVEWIGNQALNLVYRNAAGEISKTRVRTHKEG